MKRKEILEVLEKVVGHLFVVWLLIGSVAQGRELKYIWGDAFEDPLANGPDGNPYPWDTAAKFASKQIRSPRLLGMDAPEILSPQETRKILLKAFQAQERGDYLPGTSYLPPGNNNNKQSTTSADNNKKLGQRQNRRQGRGQPISYTFQNSSNSFKSSINNNNKRDSDSSSGSSTPVPPPKLPTTINEPSKDEPEGCVPSRLCASTYNTTAPLYGVSLTSGQPVTIVQKFPDLLQQVVFQVCKSSECEILQGECVQTYLPYLFLVIPLGPVTLTGQDYVLVESGCVCRPKYARRHDEPPPLPFIQALNH